MKLDVALDEIQRAEIDLARQLRLLAEHHDAERDVFHMGRSRADTCAEHVQRLQAFVERYGAHEPEIDDDTPGVIESLRRRASKALGRSEVSGLLLVRDLRDAYLAAQLVEIDWVILQQVAKAVRDAELLAVVTSCHEEAEQTAKWLRTRIKVTAPQVFAAG